jgi:hypothetical protein
VALIVIVVWGVGAPLAMASDHCLAMSAMCEGPCGASSCVVSGAPSATITDFVAPIDMVVSAEPPDLSLPVLELPPKSFLSA